MKKSLIKKGTYYDSVTLMSIARDIRNMDGIFEAVIVMGTDSNKNIIEDAELMMPDVEKSDANDLVIVVEGEEGKCDLALDEAEKLLAEKKSSTSSDRERRPHSLDGAIEYQPDSNLVIISIAGEFAKREAKKSLENDLHVMLFSDNVPVEDEIELKEMAQEKGLLMMGPDCGTAIINQTPLAFANSVDAGPVGIVAASGTGAQAVSSLIQEEGVGLSQVIGTGGRDLKEKVGGLEMIKDLKALDEDDSTEVIVLVSKPPARSVSEKIMKVVEDIKKPVVVNFLGGDSEVIANTNAYWASTLEEAAYKAVELIKGDEEKPSYLSDDELAKIVNSETKNMKNNQKYLRGLYTGGTLCSEALLLLKEEYGEMYSNIPLNNKYKLNDDLKSKENTVIDLGEDEFTQGSPHPMIEPGLRNDRIFEEIEDEEVGVILVDVVIGYGSHEDPAGKLVKAVKKAKEKFENKGGYLSVIASVCGTSKDPQNKEKQIQKLEDAGVRVFDTNAQAVRVTSAILNEIGGN